MQIKNSCSDCNSLLYKDIDEIYYCKKDSTGDAIEDIYEEHDCKAFELKSYLKKKKCDCKRCVGKMNKRTWERLNYEIKFEHWQTWVVFFMVLPLVLVFTLVSILFLQENSILERWFDD